MLPEHRVQQRQCATFILASVKNSCYYIKTALIRDKANVSEEKKVQIWQILTIIMVILLIILVVLYFVGRRLEKKQAEQQVQIDAAKQNVTLLIIDKKRLPIKESGLPQQVIDSTPALLRRSKLPIVKVKAGNKVMNMVADEKIFDYIPVKKEVRATVSGIYITDVAGLHSSLDKPEEKKGLFSKIRGKAQDKQDELRAESRGSTVDEYRDSNRTAGTKKATKKKYRPKKKKK